MKLWISVGCVGTIANFSYTRTKIQPSHKVCDLPYTTYITRNSLSLYIDWYWRFVEFALLHELLTRNALLVIELLECPLLDLLYKRFNLLLNDVEVDIESVRCLLRRFKDLVQCKKENIADGNFCLWE